MIYSKYNCWDGFIPNKELVDIQGWNGTSSALGLFNKNYNHQIIIDLGVWKGQSTLTLANNLKSQELKGTVIAIDTFLGSSEHHETELIGLLSGGRPDLLERFMNNIYAYNMQDIVIPFPQTSSNAYKILKTKNIHPTFVHIDAAHEYKEVLQDIQNYWELMQEGGIMICDDYNCGWTGVDQAVNEFIIKNRLEKVTTVIFPKVIFQK